MGPRSDPATFRQFAAALRPGSILHLYQAIVGKPKFHVLIAASAERSLGFVINTRPSPFIQRRPELMRRQVPMPLATHPFMHHDSFIACDDTVKLPTRDELIAGLCDRNINQVGNVHQTLFGSIALAAAGSATIAGRDADLISGAFARQVDLL
jgi:hypothetical protein